MCLVLFSCLIGIKENGAVLIRPDGVIARHSVDIPGNPLTILTQAFAEVSFAVKGK